jgi:hypothetical protein
LLKSKTFTKSDGGALAYEPHDSAISCAHPFLSLSQLTYNLFSLSLLYNITILFPPLEEEEEEMIENVLGIS